jgi:hypothetical protein
MDIASVVVTALFIVVMTVTCVALKFAGMPLWMALLSGMPAGFALTMGIIFAAVRLSDRRKDS